MFFAVETPSRIRPQFMPTIYTAYFALLPFWPNEAPMPFYPYTPKDVYSGAAERYSPRALLMLGLVVRLLNV